MSNPLLLGIDEGTTAVKAALFELDLSPVAEARRTVGVTHPRPGWVEQDPELILDAVVDCVAEVLEAAGRDSRCRGRARPPGRVGAGLGCRQARHFRR